MSARRADAPAAASLGRILYGGTFDPPHRRHLEVAAAALRLLGDRADGVDFIPSARPPHKPGRGVLPFPLRCALVEAALAQNGDGRLACNRMEGERRGPSYTWDTLAAFRADRPGVTPWFLLGGEDYALLPTWRRGLELPRLCSLLVAPRGDVADAASFLAVTRENWPDARELAPLRAEGPDAPRMALPGGGEAVLLPLAPEAVSSSEVRAAWLAGRPPEGVPEKVLRILEQHREAVAAAWREER
ncbi:nicotinate-nicotinamide nucleotide adenylyltransferase [Desulfovibrio sp.]|uniref:nicotinate-nicotinamide nucleotide adenylyltransferase n=1 Tax=Desulfovibrio sp. TaxID=885 RepID=UPI0023CDDA51|nr:nicotinate-nicotinamide nucleotide adenylyltransferase [Desulfovibrio sp.]MDE7241428.1 nicotinate-nicotinamide nucleotide adenylyltransferase [Desulfovibrio sp.]